MYCFRVTEDDDDSRHVDDEGCLKCPEVVHQGLYSDILDILISTLIYFQELSGTSILA